MAMLSLSIGPANAKLVKRFSRLPARESLFCSHRKVTKRCGPMACRPHGEVVRVRKHWPGWVEGASLRLQPNPRDPSRVPQAAFPSSTCRQERAGESQAKASAAERRLYAARALHAFDLSPISGRRGGAEKARRVARMDSGQFAGSTGMCCQRTPEPACVVVRLHRTTDPLRAHLLVTFLCEQKSDSAGDSRKKRLTRVASATSLAKSQIKMGSRLRGNDEMKCLTSLATAEQSKNDNLATASMRQHRNRMNRR